MQLHVNFCWNIMGNITNPSTVPYKYALFIFLFFPWIFLDIAKPRLQRKITLIIFSLNDITSQLQKTKLCAL